MLTILFALRSFARLGCCIKRKSYRSSVADAFGMPNAPTLATRGLHKSTLSITELKCERAGFGITAPIPREDAYLVGLQFLPCSDHDLFFDGRHVQPTNWFPGVTTIYDLRRDPVADIRDPFHSLMFHLPRTALDAVTYELGVKPVSDLRHHPGTGIDDPIVRHLLSSLLPAMANPEEASVLFLDHVAMALSAHIAHRYGDIKPHALSRSLSPSQERRAKELMRERLSGDIPLSRLAAECGLSVGHFARAFRHSTGVPPHRWLLLQRVARAKDLLRNPNASLKDVALSCGFANQSHLTRVFTNSVGCPPGEWRRRNALSD